MAVQLHPTRSGRSCFLVMVILLALSLVMHFVLINDLLGPQNPKHHLNVWSNRSMGIQWEESTTPNQNKPVLPSIIPSTSPDLERDLRNTPYANRYHVVYPRNYHFIMDEPLACKTKSPFLVLIVPVEPRNMAARDAIRWTWGNETLVLGKRVLTLFLLGFPGGSDAQQQLENIRLERQRHRDLIQSSFIDSYHNLTIKTMVMLDWLATRCPGASYAMKIDSDMFLNVQNLVKMLQTPNIPHENYLTGSLRWDRPVVRDPDSKWYVPEVAYPNLTYPTYTVGMGYVFSNDLPGKLVEVSKDVQPFNVEDAYVGACLKKLGYEPISPPDPSQWRDFVYTYNRCEFSSVITYILQGPEELVENWTDLHRPEPPCEAELKEGNG